MFVCRHVHTSKVSVDAPRSQKKSVEFPAARVTGGSELPRGCYMLNLHFLEEEYALLATKPSLQSLPVFPGK